ncbi:hypothetical protein [Kitasatospora sp. NPDC059673]|uniref:hypothetical protein n=1 Tax=Kitasatospora sp. NPDC059673 TaxID=3346901 RepID=UPI0036AAB0A2
MAVDVRVRGRAAHSAVLRELLLLWEAARRAGGRTITQKHLARLGGIGPSTLNGWLSGRSVPREIDRLTIVAGELARAAGRPVRQARYWAALRDADRAQHSSGAMRPGQSGRKAAPDARSAADGHPEAPAARAGIFAATGRTDQAIAWWERAWEQGVTTVHEAADVWETAGRINEAAACYERAASDGDETARHETAALFAGHGQYSVLPWYANIGDHQALRERGEQCEREGDLAGALNWYRQSAEAGSEAALFQAADMLERNGDRDRAVHWYELAAKRGDTYAMRELGRLLGELGRWQGSVSWYRAAARAGDRRVLPEAVRVVEQLDRRSATASDRPRSHPRTHPLPAPAEDAEASAARLLDAVELLKDGGRYFEANLLQSLAERSVQARLREASRMLSGSVNTDAAIEWVQRFADAGDRQAVSEAAEMLEYRGRIEEALDWYARAADVGDRDALLAAARMLADRRQTERALEWYRRAEEAGVPLAHGEAMMLRQQEDGAEGEAARRCSGRNPQALPATPAGPATPATPAGPAVPAVPIQRGQLPGETGSPRPEVAPVAPTAPAPTTRRARIPRQPTASGRAKN